MHTTHGMVVHRQQYDDAVHYLVAAVAALAIAVIGGQLLLLTPEGWPSTAVAVLSFLAAAWAARFIVRHARR